VNDEIGDKVSRNPTVKESLTVGNKQYPALDRFVCCNAVCNHIKAKTLKEDRLDSDSIMQKMHFAMRSNWLPSLLIM